MSIFVVATPKLGLTFSQFLSATIGPSVARVSAPRMIPSLNKHPTMVVPVLVAFGRGMPLFSRKLLLETAFSMKASRSQANIPNLVRKVKPGTGVNGGH